MLKLLLIFVCAFGFAGIARAQEPLTVDEHMKAGAEAEQAGQKEEALQHYAAVIRLEPRHFGAQFATGFLYFQNKDWRAAASAFRVAVEVMPDNHIAHYYLGRAEKQLGNPTAAVTALKRVTEAQPDFAPAHLALGEVYEDIGELEKFLASVVEANRLKPDDIPTLNLLGHALRANRKFQEAIEPLKRVVAARPNDVDALYILGNTQLMAGTHDDAIKTLNQVLVLDPSHSEARERLRVSSVRKNLLPKLDQYRQNAEENPRSSEAQADLARTYNALGMYAESEQAYLKATALEPKNAELVVSMCVNYAEWGKTEQGIECYQQALRLKSHHVIYLSLGDLYERKGNVAEAAVAYQKAIELKPAFVFALYNLASLRIKHGQHAEAIEPLRKLLEVEPNSVHGNHALGFAYARMGNKTGAMQQYYILQNLNPRLAAELLEAIPK